MKAGKLVIAAIIMVLSLSSLALAAGPVLIYDANYSDIAANLTARQTAAGNTPTVISWSGGTLAPLPSLSGFTQVWDINGQFALSTAQQSAYLAYMQAGGAMFIMGENTGYGAARNDSLITFIATAGGGTVSINGSGNNTQTVSSGLQTPHSLSTVHFAAAGFYATPGNGVCLTSSGSSTNCAAIAFPVGSFTNAHNGSLVSVLDINFMETGYADLAFVDNLIAYMAAQSEAGQAAAGGGGFVPNSNDVTHGAAVVLDQLTVASVIDAGMAAAIGHLSSLSASDQRAALSRLTPPTGRMLWMTSRQALNDMTDSVSTRLNSWRDRNFIGSSSLEDNWGKKIQVASNGNLKGLTSSRDNNSPRFWGKVFGTHSDQDEDGDFAGYHATTTGFAVGADKMLASQWVVGGALSYAYTYTRMTDLRDGDKINANSYQATGYLSRDFGKFYVDGIFAYARHNYESQRDTVVLGTAKADYNGDELAAKLIAGVPFQLAKNAKATLFGGVEWDQLYVDSFEESGGGPLSLNVDSNRAMSFRSLLGAKISMKYSVGQGITATPTVMVGWRHEFTNDALDSTSSFTGGGATFFTPGQTLAKNTMSLALGSSFQKSDRFSLNVMANADKSSGYVAYSGQVVGRWSF